MMVFTMKSGHAQLVLRENGSICELRDESTGLYFAPGLKGGWPFSGFLRDRRTGDLLHILVNEQYDGEVKLAEEGDGIRAHFCNLKSECGQVSDVDVILTFRAVEGAFRVAVTVHTKSDRYEFQELCCFSGKELSFGPPATERVCIPNWGEGLILHDPRHVQYQKGFVMPEPYWYLSYTPEFGCDLSHGWMAGYGERNGLAIGYMNHPLVSMEYKLDRDENGFEISPRFFRLRTYGEDFPFCEPDPLDLGAFLLIPTGGDWHQAADVYRARYQVEMGPNLPTLGAGSERARSLDVNLHYGIYGAHGLTAEPIFNMSFADVTVAVTSFVETYGIDPSRVVVWLYGIGQYGHDRCNPTQRPINREAGGEEGWRAMISDLKALGVGSIMNYTHAFATQQSQPDYDPAMDVGKGWKMMGAVYHTCLCLDNQPTLDLYRDKVLLPFKEDGVTDIFLDQPTICKGVCERDNHDHPTTWVGKLGAHARGTRREMDLVHEVFGKDSVINIEGWLDLGCRDVEIDTNSNDFTGERVVNGVERNPDVNQYCFPHVLRMKNHQSVANVVPMMIRGHNLMLSHIAEETEAVRKYLSFRDALLGEKVPGFPYGYRDTVGLASMPAGLDAKLFVAPGEGMTLTWHAREAVNATVSVDGSVHGVDGEWTVEVQGAPGESGYAAWRTER